MIKFYMNKLYDILTNVILIIPITLSLLLLSSCSYDSLFTTLFTTPEDPAQNSSAASSFDLLSLDLYIARSSLMSGDFEQFKLVGNQLFFECGQVQRATPRAAIQKLIVVDDSSASIIRERAVKLMTALSEKKEVLPAPGKLQGFSDDGQTFLTLTLGDRKEEIKTSLDCISNADASGPYNNFENSSPVKLRIRRLIVAIREAVMKSSPNTTLCNGQLFYGIQSKT